MRQRDVELAATGPLAQRAQARAHLARLATG